MANHSAIANSLPVNLLHVVFGARLGPFFSWGTLFLSSYLLLVSPDHCGIQSFRCAARGASPAIPRKSRAESCSVDFGREAPKF